MKQLLLLASWIISFGIIAQAPQSIPYQAVVRNTDGSVLANAEISITFKVHDINATGNVVYEETHITSSNTQGLIALNVGGGTPITGTFSNINWGSGAKFLHVVMNSGSGIVDLGTQQMMSVPYALHAGEINVNISSIGDTLSIGTSSLIVPGLSNSNTNTPQYSVSNMFTQGNGVFDIDGNFYPSIILYNGQEWMQKNLEVTRYRNGDSLITGLDEFTWAPTTSGAYVASELANLPYGNYYNWYAVNDSRGICPTGWHVPNYSEWNLFKNSLGGDAFAGCLMKSTESWSDPTYPNFNLSGFSGLSGGYSTSGTIVPGYMGTWWSSSVNVTGWPIAQLISNGSNSNVEHLDYNHQGYNIRCIKD